jgi:pilus assembly protein Flp/PilA
MDCSHTLFLKIPPGRRRIYLVLGYRLQIVKVLKRLCADKVGVASFEYVMAAACIVAAVATAFGTNASGSIATALANVFTAIGAAIATAVNI